MADPAPGRRTPAVIAAAMRWAIPALTIALLAVTASQTVGPASADTAAASRLVATAHPGSDPAGRSRDFWVNSVIIDGARARFDSTMRITGWEVIPRWGSGMPASAEYRDTASAAIMVLAKGPDAAVVDTWEWPGTLVMSGHPPADSAAHDLRPVRGTVVLGRELTAQVPVLVFSALLLLLVALRTGAARPGRRMAWLAISLSAWHACFWLSQAVGTTGDSQGYLDSFALVIGSGKAAYFPPGYALLIGLTERLAGEWTGLAVTAAQHGLAIGAGLLTYLLARRLIAEGPAWWIGAAAGGLPAVVSMAQSIMSEVPAMFAMVGTVYFALRARERASTGSAVCSGLLAGWVIIARVVPIVALVPALFIVFMLPWSRRAPRPLAVSVGTAAAVVLAPVLVFWFHMGSPRLTVSTGFHLFNRIVTEQRQLDERGDATRELVARFGSDPRGIAWWDVAESPGLRDIPEEDAERLFARVAMEGLLLDPWAYLRSTPPLAWREYRSDPTGWIPRWGETPIVLPHFENQPLGGVTATSLRWRLRVDTAHGLVWPPLAWLALAGTVIGAASRARVIVLALAWIPLAYLYASASVEYFAPRHNVPVIPFVVMLAGVIINWTINRGQHLAALSRER